MCHAVPARIVELLDAGSAKVEIGGVRQRISTELVGPVAVGDWVVVHVGYALGRLDEAQAAATLALLGELDSAFAQQTQAGDLARSTA